MFLLALFYCYRYSASFCRRLAVLLGLSACVLCLVCQFLGFGGFALQDVQAVAQRGDLAFIAGTLHLGAARHEVVPQGDKGEGIVLRCDGLAVHQPVDFTFQP